jgi:PTS system mannose-specific IIC component
MIVEALLISLVMYIAKFCDHGLGQPMVERPLVLAALVGLVLGHVTEGVVLGATLELIFLGTITIGGSYPADTITGSILASAFVIMLGKGAEVAVTLAVPISMLAVFVYNVIKLVYTAAVEKFDVYLDAGRDQAFSNLQIFLTLFKPFVYSVLTFFAITLGTSVIESAVNAIPPVVMKGLTTAAGVLPALGFAILLKNLWHTNIAAFFFIGFAMVAYLKLPIMGVAIFAGAIAVYNCFSEYDLNKALKSKVVTQSVGPVNDKEDFFQ